jgi:hypothetical protein
MVAPDLRAIVLKAVAFSRDDRYSSVTELKADIKNYMRGKAVGARKESWSDKLARFGMRHRKVLLFTVVLSLFMMASAVAFGLYQKLFRDRNLFLRSMVISEAMADCSRNGSMVDRICARMELLLVASSNEAMFLVNRSNAELNPDRKNVISASEFRENSGQIEGHKRIYYSFVEEITDEKLFSRIMNVGVMQENMLRRLLECFSDVSLADKSEDELLQMVHETGRAKAMRFYFGTQEHGLMVFYPATVDLPPGYDPRNRYWYTVHSAGGDRGIKWVLPHASSENKAVLTCTLPLYTKGNQFFGVSAVDLDLAELIYSIRQQGNTGASVVGKFLVTEDGHMLVSSDDGFIESLYDETYGGKYDLDPVLLNLFTHRKSGFVVRMEEGREVIYFYVKLATEKWYYVEKIDLQKKVKAKKLVIEKSIDRDE